MTTTDHVRRDGVRDARDLAHDAIETRYDSNGRAVWGAIFAGAVYALGLYVLLSLVGLGLGLSLFEPTDGTPMNGSLTTTAVWQFVSQLVALAVGGYTAGRLAGVLHPMGSMLHGAVVWALTTLVAVWMATQAAMGIVNVAGSAVSGLASGASSAASAVLPDDFSLPDLSVGSLSMDDLPPQVQSTLRQNGLTPENFQAEAREAFRAVVSQQEQANLRQSATNAAQDIVTSPGDAREDVNDFLDRTFGRGGILSEEDRAEAVAVMEDRFGLTPAQAEEYVNYVQTRAEALQQEAAQAVEEAQTQAIQAADAAADATASAAWLAALASLLGLASAVGGAYFGRPARA
ncbi:hypothetical protein [Jannaschia sp. LMIT008]|uniref:hypothetical protein n=1 Tax=Jannaschia maritima TaxID=3032585 RepID=UPI002810FC20|nr:hypothetical protein [Jannaschia sp. LMIT008]